MNKNNVTFRLERKEEYREVENLVRESFWNIYRPGCLEHYVLNQLRNYPAFVKELDFVMELDGITGEYSTPGGYFVCEENTDAFEAYEAGFPFKEKLKLPGQLF